MIVNAKTTDIQYCREKEIQFILRLTANNICFCDNKGKVFDIRDKIIGENISEELNVYVKTKEGNIIPVRVCFKKKDEQYIETTKKRLRRFEQKHQRKMSERTKEFHEYIVVATSLDKEKITKEEVLELYFKRLKSILDYGELPKKKEESIFVWLNGKLMIALLLEKIISKTVFFPKEKQELYEEYLERTEIY